MFLRLISFQIKTLLKQNFAFAFNSLRARHFYPIEITREINLTNSMQCIALKSNSNKPRVVNKCALLHRYLSSLLLKRSPFNVKKQPFIRKVIKRWNATHIFILSINNNQ